MAIDKSIYLEGSLEPVGLIMSCAICESKNLEWEFGGEEYANWVRCTGCFQEVPQHNCDHGNDARLYWNREQVGIRLRDMAAQFIALDNAINQEDADYLNGYEHDRILVWLTHAKEILNGN